jgi:predicted dithiol-disulfide oxidoreductase (DUF899 family)
MFAPGHRLESVLNTSCHGPPRRHTDAVPSGRSIHFRRVTWPARAWGGRAPVRAGLYMATIAAVRFNPEDIDQRGIDLLCPLWHVLDLTPEGPDDWYAELSYAPREHAHVTRARRLKR